MTYQLPSEPTIAPIKGANELEGSTEFELTGIPEVEVAVVTSTAVVMTLLSAAPVVTLSVVSGDVVTSLVVVGFA